MDRFLARVTIGAAVLLAASIVLVSGVAFLLFALYLGLQTLTTPPLSALVTGGAALVIAAIIIIAGRLIAAAPRTRPRAGAASDAAGAQTNKLAADLGELLGKELVSLVRANPRSTAVVSLLSGFALAAFPELRQVIARLIDKSDSK